MAELESRLDFDTVPVLARSLDSAASEVDLSQIEHCNSAGIALLLEWKRRNNQIVFNNPSPQIETLARFGGVDELLFGPG